MEAYSASELMGLGALLTGLTMLSATVVSVVFGKAYKFFKTRGDQQLYMVEQLKEIERRLLNAECRLDVRNRNLLELKDQLHLLRGELPHETRGRKY